MLIKRWLLILVFMIYAMDGYAWNAVGHRLIAKIAYDHMTPHAKRVFNHYNHALDTIYKPLSWMHAAVWLDTLRYQDIAWFDTIHYVDIPISKKNSYLPQANNAIWAVEKANKLLLNPYATDFDKGIALRILLHVVGDLHQPLHTATKISAEFSQGDKGGNLVPLKGTPVAKNLHAYWDRGGGFLIRKHYNDTQMMNLATQIEQAYPCSANAETNPKLWADESHALAVTLAYQPMEGKSLPDARYQQMAQQTTEKQVALAGCRLGVLLNQLAERLTKTQRKTRHRAHVGRN